MRNAIAVAGSILMASCASEPAMTGNQTAEALCLHWYKSMPSRNICYGPEKSVCVEVLTEHQDTYYRVCETTDIFNPATYGREDNGS